MPERKDRPWLDVLRRKHECGPALSPYRTISVEHDGRGLRVSIPDNIPEPERLEIRQVLVSGPILVLIGFHAFRADPEGCGIVMIARQSDGGDYVVHVWHELYPWAIPHLGLGEIPRP